MIKLYPTFIKIDNYEQGMSPRLEKSLSVWNQYNYCYEFSAFLIDETNKEIIIPGGYPIHLLQKYFPAVDIENHRNEFTPYREVEKYALLSKPKNDIQVKAINFLRKTLEPQKYLALPTGKGKTYCVINYLYKCRKLPLVIVDQENLMNQWKESIKKFTSIMEDEIYIIRGKKSVNELMNMKEEELKKYKYFLGIHRTFSLLFEENPNIITELFRKIKIGVKVFDEAHIEYYNIFYMDSVTSCETIYLSATPERSNPNEKRTYTNIFNSVPLYKPFIDERYLNTVKYQINTKSSAEDQCLMRSKRGFDVLNYSKYIVEQEAFQVTIEDLIGKLYKNNFKQRKKIAIILKMLDHVDKANEIIQNFLQDKDSDLTIGVLTGKTKAKDKPKVLDSDIIITTDSSLTKGIDVPNLEAIINFVPIGTIPKLNQITGRLRFLIDKEVFFIDVVDESVPDLCKQFKTRMTYYRKVSKKVYTMKGFGFNE